MHKNGLSAFQLTMMALGTVVGGSFFLATSIAIRASGPSIIIGFILGGILVYIILNALSEMTVANPCVGSFRTHAAQTYGPFVGYMVGWVYWTGLILTMSSEATAAALLIKSWSPQLSLPLLSIAIVLGVTFINLLGAQQVTKLESSLAGVKILALVLFIVIAALLIFGFWPGQPAVGLGELRNTVLFPHGIGGLGGSLLIVLLGYAGFEIIGLAASETRDPHKTVPRAINFTIISLLTLYITVMVLLLPLIPTGALAPATSPMVAALERYGLGVAAGVVNFVLVTAILSTMLASVFGLGRMLRSLADAGDAPAFLIDRGDVPLRGILFSGVTMLAAVSLSYVLPDRIYLFLISSGGFSLLMAYLAIVVTHLRYRRIYGCPPRGNCQLVGYPYTTWIGIISLVIAIVTMPLIPGQGTGLLAGLFLVALYSLVYLLSRVVRTRTVPAAKPAPELPPRETYCKNESEKDR